MNPYSYLKTMFKHDVSNHPDFDFSELASFININSHTLNKTGVDKTGNQYQRIFESLGFSTLRYAREKIGDHLLFTSRSSGAPKLLLLGHLDTVYPEAIFNGFSEDEHWLYGPGVCDMKGGILVAINALRKVKKQRDIIVDIDMLLVSDEETGSDDSKSIIAAVAHNYQACFVFEAAGANQEVVIGRKGVSGFTIDITGKAAHAGNDFRLGADANLCAAYMMIELNQLNYLEGGTTVNAGKISGGIGTNIISPYAQINLEVRYTQRAEIKRIVSEIDRIVETRFVEGVTAIVSGGVQREVMLPDNRQKALLEKLGSILGYPLATEQRGGVSDANNISAAGVATIDGFGPFGDGDHTINERASKKSFMLRVEQMSKILLAFHHSA